MVHNHMEVIQEISCSDKGYLALPRCGKGRQACRIVGYLALAARTTWYLDEKLLSLCQLSKGVFSITPCPCDRRVDLDNRTAIIDLWWQALADQGIQSSLIYENFFCTVSVVRQLAAN